MNPSLNPSEMEFAGAAGDLLNSLLARPIPAGDPFAVGGVSLFETSTAPLMLYYLRKACKYVFLARTELDNNQSLRVMLESLDTDLNQAIFFEARSRGLEVLVREPPQKNSWRARFRTWAWLLREVALTFQPAGKKLKPVDFLCVCNVSRQHDTLEPLIRELAGNHRIGVVSKMPLPATQRVIHPNVSYFSWGDLRSFGYLTRLLPQLVQMKKNWSATILPLLGNQDYFKTVLTKWFETMGLQTLRALLTAQTALAGLTPKAIVATDPADFEAKAFTLIGRKSSIPSLCLQYGLVSKLDSEWPYFEQDYVGVFDEAAARIIASHGVKPDRIFLTGNPRFDRYQPHPEERARIRALLKVSDQDKLVTFMSVPPTFEGTGQIESNMQIADYENLLKAAYAIPRDFGDAVVAVKPHPEEIRDFHDRLKGEAPRPDRVRFIEGLTAFEMLNASDLVITTYSTSGLEAIYLDKPLVLVQLSFSEDLVDFASLGAATLVRNLNELAGAARRLLEEETIALPYRLAREAYRQKSQGQLSSAKRCADILMALKEGRSPALS